MGKMRRQYIVVMRGESAALFKKDEAVEIKTNINNTDYTVKIRTRWIKLRENVTIPGNLWIEISGEDDGNLEKVINKFSNVGTIYLSLLSLSSNAAIGDPEIEIAFDATPRKKNHEFFQSFIPSETRNLNPARYVDCHSFVRTVENINTHPEAERIFRAMGQYRIALDYWKFGQETLTLAHLWMAVEAITPILVRKERNDRGCKSNLELCKSIGIEMKNLDSYVRRNIILCGDSECYKKAKKSSDGFEHGFLNFGDIRTDARDIRKKMSKYIRESIINIIFEYSNDENDESIVLKMKSKPYDAPIGNARIIKYFRGTLVGSAKTLNAKGNLYPNIEWSSKIDKIEFDHDGTMNLTFTENITPRIGKSVVLKARSVEMWKQE